MKALSVPMRAGRDVTRCPVCLSYESAVVRPYRATLPGSAAVFAGLLVRRCQVCAGCFADPLPDQDVLQQYYAADYRGVGSWHRREEDPGAWDGSHVRARAQYEFVLRQASLGHGVPLVESWLDVGAGYGFLLDEARKRGVSKTAAIEPDEHGRARLTRSGHDVVGALEQVASPWDVISFSHLLEHLPTPLRFLRQVRSLLSDRGYVFCEVPNDTHVDEATNDAPHLVFFNPACLVSAFETVGFQVLAVQTCGRWWGRRWTDAFRDLMRRVGMRTVATPPRWLDRAVHPHFHYSQGGRQWIRLLATSSRSHAREVGGR